MNQKLEEFKEGIKNKKVGIIGMGVSHMPLIEYLLKLSVDVTVFDKSEKHALKDKLDVFSQYPVKYHLGPDYLKYLKGLDILFKTPGIRFDLPELIEARENGTVITSEMEVFFDLCPAEIFAVTGSDGKTTTTTILYHLLKEEGYSCWLGGNIGTPLLNRIDEINPDDKVILELSSFQLQTMTKSPHVAVITNLSPNHLDFHHTMDEYIEAKKNIFKFQHASDKLILNHDNVLTRQLASEAPSTVYFFSRFGTVQDGAVFKDGKLCFSKEGVTEAIIDRKDIQLPGDHNVENFLAAIAVAKDYVSHESIQKVGQALTGIPHRIEFVREIKDVRYYNDSVASSPTRTIATLNAFDQKVILIAGGYDKKIPYDPLTESLIQKVKHLILIGQTASLIERAMMAGLKGKNAYTSIRVTNCTTLEQAVYTAYFSAKPGDIVLLSPASASFDMFKDFEERGRLFKDIVSVL